MCNGAGAADAAGAAGAAADRLARQQAARNINLDRQPQQARTLNLDVAPKAPAATSQTFDLAAALQALFSSSF